MEDPKQEPTLVERLLPRRQHRSRAGLELRRRRRSKIANLPKEQRDEINRMLNDGFMYKDIMARVLEFGLVLNTENLTRWCRAGFRDWIEEQERLAEMSAKRELALDVVKMNGGESVQEAGLQLASMQIYELLMALNPKNLKNHVEGDPVNYARVLAALTRLGDGGLKYERYRAEVAERKANIERELTSASAPASGIPPQTRARIEEE